MANHGLSAASSRARNTEQLEERTRELCARLGIKSGRLTVRQATPEEQDDLKRRAARKRPRPFEADDDGAVAAWGLSSTRTSPCRRTPGVAATEAELRACARQFDAPSAPPVTLDSRPLLGQ